MIRGAQPSTGTLLAIQPVTTFASLIWAGTCVESSLRSGNFLALSTFAKQATASGSSHSGSSSSTTNNNSSNNNNPRRRDPPWTAVAYVDSSAAPVHMVAQPGPNQVVYTPTPSAPPIPQITTTARPVYLIAPVRQGQHQGQRRPYHHQRRFTQLVELLSAIFPKVTSLLMLPEVCPPPNPFPRWYKTDQFCNFH